MPYHELDYATPLNVYGMSKAEGEKLVSAYNPDALIVRTSAFFGPWDKYNFVYHVIESLKRNERFYTTNDITISPTYVPDLADIVLDIFLDNEHGIWHIANEGAITWSEWAKLVANKSGYTANSLEVKTCNELGWKAIRPKYSVLQSSRGIKLPSLENALSRYLKDRTV